MWGFGPDPFAVARVAHHRLPEATVAAQHTAMTDRTGTVAADFELADADGRVRRLEDWRGRWLALVFHRHLG